MNGCINAVLLHIKHIYHTFKKEEKKMSEGNRNSSSIDWDSLDRREDEEVLDYEARAFAAEFAEKQGYDRNGYSDEY